MSDCVHYGKKQYDNAKYCHHCGKRLLKEEKETEKELAASVEIEGEEEDPEEKINRILKNGEKKNRSGGATAALTTLIILGIILSRFVWEVALPTLTQVIHMVEYG